MIQLINIVKKVCFTLKIEKKNRLFFPFASTQGKTQRAIISHLV